MRSTHTREQDFMAITAKVEVLCQQLKGRGMYTVPSMTSTTNSSKSGNSVHFQPIDPAQNSSVQAMDQLLLNSSLNLLDDSPRSQSSSSNGPIPHGQAMPRVPEHKSNYPVPPTPYVNQTAVDQHMRAQPAPIPPRTSLSPINVQSPKQVQSPQLPDSVQPQRLPFVDAPPAPAKNHQADNTSSPSTLETMSKSLNRQGVKQSSSESSSASTSTGKSGPICWNCQEVGHRRRNCKNPSYCSKCKQSGHLPVKCTLKGKKTEKSQTQQKGQQTSVDPMFSNIRNKCIRCGGDHAPGSCPTKTRPQAAQNAAGYQTYDNGAVTGKANANHLPSFSSKNGQPTAANMTPSSPKNSAGAQRRPSCTREPITPQVSPNTSQQNFYNVLPVHPPNHFAPPPYFPIPFPPPPIAPSNASNAHSAPVSDISAVLSLMTNAVTQGNSNTTAIATALERTTMQFADALQQTIQMGVDAQVQENKNARMDKQFEKVKVFDGSNPSECHPWLEEVHALCIQTGRPFCKMLLLCAGQAVRDFITDMSPEATDDQIKNDLITGYSDLQGLGCKQSTYDSIMQRPDEPLRSYIVRYSRLFKLLNGTAPDDVRMRTTSMHFVNSLCNYLSSKVENRLLGMNEKNYSLGDTFKVALECELKAIASKRRHAKRATGSTNQVEVVQPQPLLQSEEVSEIHVRNPNYKGKNYDPNFQAKHAEVAHSAGKQQQNSFAPPNQYKPAYNKPTSTDGSNNNTPLSNSSDIIGEVTLKTSVDGYQLLKVNKMIKNAVAWRARMPKVNKISTYFNGNSKDATQKIQEPKVHINEATLKVMGQAAKDFGYTEQEFVEAVEMYQYFGNQNLEDVPIPNSQD